MHSVILVLFVAFTLQISLFLNAKTLPEPLKNSPVYVNTINNQRIPVLIPRQDEDDDDLTIKSADVSAASPAAVAVKNQGRQDEDDDETTVAPEVPAIIPGVTKIFNGLLTGNLNDILKGSFSFAPRNVSHAINTVYNSVVGLPPPKRMTAPTEAPEPAAATGASAGQSTVATASATEATDEDEDTEEGSRVAAKSASKL